MFWIEGLTIFKLAQIIAGTILVMFLPGFLLTLAVFKEMDWLEKIALGFGLSISMTTFIGLLFTFPNDNRISSLVEGINGVFYALIIVSGLFLIILYFQNKKWCALKIRWLRLKMRFLKF